MKVFVTGSTGFIGSRLVPELLKHGHTVLGMTRSDDGEKQLVEQGAEPYRGDIYDLKSIREGARQADAVIHLAFNHNFATFAENCETDRKLIQALGEELHGTNKLMVITSGTAIARGVNGAPAAEHDLAVSSALVPRAKSEEQARAAADLGVRVAIVRLAQIHDPYKQGLVPYAAAVAREKGVSAYVGDGSNRWPAAHVDDTAVLYRLALEKTGNFGIYHAVDEEGVSMKEIAESLGRGLKVPVKSISAEEVPEHFGWLAHFIGQDLVASSEQTRKVLGWEPKGPGLIEDLEKGLS